MPDTVRVSTWYLLRNGESGGPFDDATIVAWISEGMADAQIKPDSADSSFPWLALESHAPFAEALRARSQRTASRPSPARPRADASAPGTPPFIAGLLGVVVGGGVVALVVGSASTRTARDPTPTPSCAAPSAPAVDPPSFAPYAPPNARQGRGPLSWAIAAIPGQLARDAPDPWARIRPEESGEIAPAVASRWRCRYGPAWFPVGDRESDVVLGGSLVFRPLICSSDGWITTVQATGSYVVDFRTGHPRDLTDAVIEIQEQGGGNWKVFLRPNGPSHGRRASQTHLVEQSVRGDLPMAPANVEATARRAA
jgi:hypothetical protein